MVTPQPPKGALKTFPIIKRGFRNFENLFLFSEFFFTPPLGGWGVYLFANFDNSLNISIYNQTMVTSKPNAPYHSIYFGAPIAAPLSIMSKSRIRFRAATHTTTNE